MSILAIYPGTFDPFTHGHHDIVMRAAKLFEQLIVGVAVSDHKRALLTHAERIKITGAVLKDLSNVKVMGFEGLTVDFAKKQGASVLIRGLRNASDVDYELQMGAMNRQIAPNIETIFLTPTEQYSKISSTMVREIVKLGGDISPFVNEAVLEALGADKWH